MGIEKTNYSFDEKVALASSLEILRKTNRFLLSPIKSSELESNSVLEEYLLRPFSGEGSNIELDKEFEKSVMTSIIASRPKFFSLEFAKGQAGCAIEELRSARIFALHESGKLNSKEFEDLKRNNWVSNSITKVQRVKRILKRKALRYGLAAALTLAGVPVAGVIALGGQLIWDILPARTKENIKKTTKEVIHTTAAVIKESLCKLQKVGENVAGRVIESISNGVQRVTEMAKPVVETVKEVVKAGCDIIMSVPLVKQAVELGKKISEKISSWF